MFKANQDTMFVPTKTISIKPEAQIDYNPDSQNQVRWLIPQYIGFFDPRGTMLKYHLQFSGRGHHRPDGKAGVHALWRDLRLRDGSSATELETIQDYNVLTSAWWDYTSNESINHKRDMFEGRSVNFDIDQQLFYGASGDWPAAPITASFERHKVEIEQPIHSGILGGDKVFPVVATKGLRFEMTLDKFVRSCVAVSTNGDSSRPYEIKVAIEGSSGATAEARQEKAAIGDSFPVVIKRGSDSLSGVGINRSASPVNNNSLDIGDRLYISNADGTGERSLGVIYSFGADVDGDMEVHVIPDRALGVSLGADYLVGSHVYFKETDRLNGVTVTDVPATQIAEAAKKVSYQISDIELLLLQVQPPQAYVDSMMKQMSSEKGLSLDYRTWSLYRVNVTTRDGLTDQLIPAGQRRAYSILSVPLGAGLQSSVSNSAFRGLIDECKDYQYVFGGHLIPDRPISLERYTQTPVRSDALHLIETEKALINCGYGVRNLLDMANKFLIARGFSKYNQVFDLSGQSLSLRIQYDSSTQDKLFEHFVQYLKRVNISSAGVMTME